MNQHKTELKKCEMCQSEFGVRTSDLKRGFGRFCSYRCRNQRRGQAVHSHPIVDVTRDFMRVSESTVGCTEK